MTAAPSSRVRRRVARHDGLAALPFLAPWLLGTVLFFGYPLVSTVILSFTHYDQYSAPTFVGLKNWTYVLTQYRPFTQALANTGILVALMVPSSTIFALLTGMIVLRIKRGSGVFRTLYYLPYLAPPVAATLAFVFLLSPRGALNQLLNLFGVRGPNWFGDPSTAKSALTLLTLWGVGNLMVIFLAALLDVPQQLYEAASIDGAGRFAQFWYVTLPTIKPILLFSVITGVIQTMQYYTQAVVAGRVASGQSIGPGAGFELGYPGGSTLTLPQLVYTFGFQNFDAGSASVVAVIMMVAALGLTAVLLTRGSGFLTEGE